MHTAKVRASGLRKLKETRIQHGGIGPLSAFGTSGERLVKVNAGQMMAIDQVFYSDPIIFAARNVLQGHITAGGVFLQRNGDDVEVRQEFREHLEEHWVLFAKQCVDSLMKYGFVVVGFDRCVTEAPNTGFANEEAAGEGSARKKSRKRKEPVAMGGVVPIVIETGEYDLFLKGVGERGYSKQYVLTNEQGEEDPDAFVFAKQHPDRAGNVTSAMAALFETETFTAALHEFALTAEASRCRPQLCTQMRKKDQSASAIDASNLFFDSEARDAHSDAIQEESRAAANSLAMQKIVCDAINATQTRPNVPNPAAPQDSRRHFEPPDVKPVLFCLPQDHEVAPAAVAQSGRGDLEALSRFAAEKICAALGVPAELIFSGRYVSNSSSSLRMLSSTVSEMAKSVNHILTKCYRRIYGLVDDKNTELHLLVNPVVDREAIISSYAAGLIPRKVAMATVMQDVGASRTEVTEALASIKEQEEKEAQEGQAQAAVASEAGSSVEAPVEQSTNTKEEEAKQKEKGGV